MRCFNNYVKSLLINEVTKRPKLSVLDLCCGKGGDLPFKWKQAKIAHYIGSDLSKESIKSAKLKHEDSILNSSENRMMDRSNT